ncbi:hypothetical protein ACHAQE_001563 [Botrytis cinerea]
MVDSTPATINPLISCCLEYLKEWPGVKSLYIARAINYEQIETLDHCGIKYLNGVIGLGLASILTSEESSHHYKHNHQIDWHPLEISLTYSTIELLAQVELHGAISLAKLPGIVYKDLPLTTRVLIAFSEVKLESHENAQHMLGSVFPEVKMVYGFQSMEVFLVGTTLANCLNRCRMEALAEGLVSSTFRKAVSRLEVPTTAQEFLIRLSIIPDYYTNSELSMVVAFADSLLGQGKHDDAMSLFQAILKKRQPGCEEVTMSVALRISKITRRLNAESPIDGAQGFDHSDALDILRDISGVYSRVSSILKYAYVEEVICHLSLLEDIDTRQRFMASEIIKVLNRESLPYRGSENSRIGFLENLQAINQYAEQLKSQLNKKTPESLTGNMTKCFPDATIDLVEMTSPHGIQPVSQKAINSSTFYQTLPPKTSRPDTLTAFEYMTSSRQDLLERRRGKLSLNETRPEPVQTPRIITGGYERECLYSEDDYDDSYESSIEDSLGRTIFSSTYVSSRISSRTNSSVVSESNFSKANSSYSRESNYSEVESSYNKSKSSRGIRDSKAMPPPPKPIMRRPTVDVPVYDDNLSHNSIEEYHSELPRRPNLRLLANTDADIATMGNLHLPHPLKHLPRDSRGYNAKLSAVANYLEEVSGPTIPLTVEALEKHSNRSSEQKYRPIATQVPYSNYAGGLARRLSRRHKGPPVIRTSQQRNSVDQHQRADWQPVAQSSRSMNNEDRLEVVAEVQNC